MLAALDAGADDVADDGGTWRVTCDTVADVRRARRRSRPPASRSSLGRHADGVGERSCRSPTSRTPRKVLRIIEAIEDNDDVQDVYSQLRHRRRRDGPAGEPDERRGGGPGPGVHAAGHRRRATYSLADFAGQPGRARRSTRATTRRCARSSSTPTTTASSQFAELDAQVLGISAQDVASHERFSRQARLRVPAARRHRQGRRRPSTARSDRSASRGAACSSSTAAASIRYAHRAIAGLTYRPVTELLDALRELDYRPSTVLVGCDRCTRSRDAQIRARDHRRHDAVDVSYEPVFATRPCRRDRARARHRPRPHPLRLRRRRRARAGCRVAVVARRDPHAGRRPVAAAAGRAARRAGRAARRVRARRGRRRAGVLPGQRAHGDERRPGERAGARRGGARRVRGRAVHAEPGEGRRRRLGRAPARRRCRRWCRRASASPGAPQPADAADAAALALCHLAIGADARRARRAPPMRAAECRR